MNGWFANRFTFRPGAIECSCANCACTYWLPPSKAARYKTCGAECAAAMKATALIARVIARTRSCESCGSAFVPRKGQIDAGQDRYCSQPCSIAAALKVCRSPEANAKRVASRRKTYVPLFGAEHPSWKGGVHATRARRRDSGKAAAEVRNYRASNPEKVREFAQIRSRRKFGRLPRGTVARIGEEQKWRCQACAADLHLTGFHLDHIKALAVGGGHEPSNVQLLCPTCNVRKGTKDFAAFLAESRGAA